MFNKSRRVLTLLVLLPLALLSACGSKPGSVHIMRGTTPASSGGFPLTLKAANGTVHLQKRPTAIISLSPTATEMLYAIGAGKQVKAVDEFSNYPPNAPRTKLDGLQPNIEAIASYKPDLVVVSDDPASLNHQLAALSIPVLYQPAATSLNSEYAEFTQLGKATGDEKGAAREVRSIKSQVASIVKAAPKTAKGDTYYFELDQTYYSVTSKTFIGQVLSLLGLHSIADGAKGAASSGGYPQLSAEYILHENPDYIFLADTICCHQSAATVAKRPGWSSLKAVKGHRVLGLNDNIASRWGPRIVDLLRSVATELRQHPAG